MAVSAAVVTLVATASALIVETRGEDGGLDPLESMLVAVGMIGISALGVLIVIRTGNPIGWLFLIEGVLGSWGLWTEVRGDAAGPIEQWLGGVLWWPTLLILPAVILLFPDGRLPSPRWRFVWWLGGGFAVAAMLGTFFAPTIFDSDEPTPFAGFIGDEVLATLEIVGMALALPFLVAVLAAPVFRYRRADTVQRLQLRWFGLGAFVTLGGLIAFEVIWWELESALPVLLTEAALPVAITLAIVRYRLYEIDRLISRTVSYALIIASLGGLYASIVVGLPLLVPFTSDSPLVVASATLLAAALFDPLRRRIRSAVDRRFNRARYDARQEVELFSNRLPTDFDIDDLRSGMLAVVTSTMHPERAVLWVSDAGSQPRS